MPNRNDELDSELEMPEGDGGELVAVSDLPREEGEELRTDEPLDEAAAKVISPEEESRLDNPAELRSAIEAILFASPEPLPLKRLVQALEADQKSVRQALHDLTFEYDEQRRGFQIIEVAGGFQMATRERYADYILRLGTKKKPPSLSGATLETLAIIAYRQPVIRAEIESIRGVESSGTIRNLLDLGLIEIVGRKEVIGRPPLYGTTEKFLRSFGLRKIDELPSIRGLRERFAEEIAEEKKRFGESETTEPAIEEVNGDGASGELSDEGAAEADPIDNAAIAEAMEEAIAEPEEDAR
jgi:segregation and condensation protein B